MVCRKVSDHCLIQTFFDHESYHTEENWVQRITRFADVVKMNFLGKPTIFLRLLMDAVCEAFSSAMERQSLFYFNH